MKYINRWSGCTPGLQQRNAWGFLRRQQLGVSAEAGLWMLFSLLAMGAIIAY